VGFEVFKTRKTSRIINQTTALNSAVGEHRLATLREAP
jgi:hypothetical protein